MCLCTKSKQSIKKKQDTYQETIKEGNYLYVSPSLFKNFQNSTKKTGTSQEPIYVELMTYKFILASDKQLPDHGMIISGITRSQLKISHTMDHPVIKAFIGGSANYLATSVKLKVTAPSLTANYEVPEKELGDAIIQKYRKHIFHMGQEVFFNFKGVDVVITIEKIDTAEEEDMNEFPYGMIFEETDYEIKSKTTFLRIKSKSLQSKSIFNKTFDFSNLGVGGMDEQILTMFRRAFGTRRLPASILEQYNKNHVKGVLLYGPPGTGKTLIARKMAQCLNVKKPKVINGKKITFYKFSKLI
jgi:vesicle-fusing ATPase